MSEPTPSPSRRAARRGLLGLCGVAVFVAACPHRGGGPKAVPSPQPTISSPVAYGSRRPFGVSPTPGGSPVVMGALPVEVVKKVISEHQGELVACANQHPAGGRVVVRFTLSGESLAVDVVDSSASAELDACVLQRAAGWKFPTPAGGGSVAFNYPFVFRSSIESTPPPPSPDVTYSRHSVVDFPDDTIVGYLLPPGAKRRVQRFPFLEAPDEVVPGREFALQVSLTVADYHPTNVEILQGEVTTSGALGLSLPVPTAREGWELDVVLAAPGFTLRDGANTAKIRLPENGDSTPAMFRLTARKTAAPREERRVFASLWHDGTFLAKVAARIEVVSVVVPAATPVARSSTAAEEDGGFDFSGSETTSDARTRANAGAVQSRQTTPQPDALLAADLTVLVSGEEMVIASPHLVPTLRAHKVKRADGLPEFLASWYGRFARAVPRGGHALGAAPEATGKDSTIAKLEGFGGEAWRRFAPAPFRDAFWSLKDKLGKDFRTLQIVTDDPSLPWELMRPSREKGGAPLDFLGVELQVARWHASEGSALQLARPPQVAELRTLTVIAPDYGSTGRALPAQAQEVVSLQAVRGYREGEGSFAGVRDLFDEEPSGIVHFAGHGVVHKDGAGMPEYAVVLEDGELDLMAWRGLMNGTLRRHPFFFFNACDLGQADKVAGFVDGWAPAVLDAGAGGYIGGLWPLGDRGAADAAGQFYATLRERLAAGDTASVASILQDTRRRFYETGDPTYLAYVYYGDPHFRFRAAKEP